MKFAVQLVITFGLLSQTLAGEVELPTDPKFPGRCIYDLELYEPGKHALPDGCATLLCREDGTMLHAECEVLPLEKCKPGDYVDVTVPYPECCKRRYTCQDGYGASYERIIPS